MLYKSFLKQVVLLMIISGSTHGQTQRDTVEMQDSTKTSMEFLTGFWKTDSTANAIEFRRVQNELQLLADKGYSYEFFQPTRFPIIGTTISWPPHGCLVKKLDKDHIEIQYTLFGHEPVAVKYKRTIQPL